MLRALSAAAVAALFVAGSASAATVTLNSTIDLSQASIGNNLFVGAYFNPSDPASPLVAPFAVSEGDTFVWNADFTANQQLTMNGLIYVTTAVTTPNVAEFSNHTVTGQLELLSPTGQVVASAASTMTDGNNFLGQFFLNFTFDGGPPASVTFAGFRYTATGIDYEQPGLTTRTYNGPSFWAQGQSLVLGSFVVVDDPLPTDPTVIPEPATWALMIGGFGLTGGVLRRRRASGALA